MGSDFYETPHLDRLASESMVFRQAYAAAANCAPSRACLLSGQYTPRHSIYNVGTGLRGNPKFSRLKHVPGTDTLRPDIVTWAQRLQSNGYSTGIIGKWHLSDDPRPYGFDVNIGGTHSGSPPAGYFPPHPAAPGLEKAEAGEYLTDRLNQEAESFIRHHTNQPWMLYLSHFAVHTPLQAKEELTAKFRDKPPGQLHQHAIMAAMIESVDEGLGRLMKVLEELDIAQRTIIMVTSDNGGYGPATSMKPLKGYKGTYYEGGLRVPMLVRWPGVTVAGSVCETPVCNVDIYPTLMDMAKISLPDTQHLDGVSLRPLLEGGELPSRALFWHFPAYLESYAVIDGQRDPLFRSRPCSIIRNGDWKLHEYYEDGGLELYNLREDVGEEKNVALSHPDKLHELHSQLIAWRGATQALIPTETNPSFDGQAEQAARQNANRPRKSRNNTNQGNSE